MQLTNDIGNEIKHRWGSFKRSNYINSRKKELILKLEIKKEL